MKIMIKEKPLKTQIKIKIADYMIEITAGTNGALTFTWLTAGH